jgi:hypothetical protein
VKVKDMANPSAGLDRPREPQEFDASRILKKKNMQMKKAEISALGVGRFYPQGGFMLLISVRG